MAAIEILGLEKTYMVGFWRKRPKRALQPLHLSVEEGEIFGFLGPNGAGKTTTLKMLMGLVFPTAGTARILGHDWTDPDVKAQIGFLPEQPYFYDYLTAHELLDYYGQLSGVPGERPQAPRGGSPAARGTDRRQGRAVAQVLERDAAAGRHRAGDSARSQAGLLRRADVGPRSAGPARGSRPDGATEARRQDGIFLDAHSFRRRGAVRPGGDHSQRRVARRGRRGRFDLDGPRQSRSGVARHADSGIA